MKISIFLAVCINLKKYIYKERIHYVAELVDLSADFKKSVGQYSGGMRRRLALAIALLQDPKLLILDAPTVGIDPTLKKKIWQLKSDKRTLALLFLAPLLVLSLMYFIFGTDEADPTLGVTDAPTELLQSYKKSDLKILEKDAYSTKQLTTDEYAAWLDIKNNQFHLLNETPSLSNKITLALKLASETTKVSEETADINYVYGNKSTTIFDIFSPMLISFFIFFFVFLIAGIALLKERTTGTLERLLATPIKRSEIVAGYMIGYGIFATIQTIIIVLFSIYILDIVSNGSIFLIFLICLVTALVALSLEIFLSSFTNSEFQMVQFIPLIIVPQILFSGIFPLESMATWLQGISSIMPLYYTADALNSVMYKGLGFSDIYLNLLILLGFSSIFLFLNMLGLRKYRRI